MFGYVQSAGSFAGVIGDLLASALNQNVTSWRSAPAATTIEHQVIEWLKAMVGFDPAGSGVLLSGGSLANFAGLAVGVARQHRRRSESRGVAALPGKPRIYTSAMTHMSIAKAASMLGIGKDAIVAVPVDAALRMDPVGAREADRERSRRRLSRGLRGRDRRRRQYRRDRSARCDRRRVRREPAVAAC